MVGLIGQFLHTGRAESVWMCLIKSDFTRIVDDDGEKLRNSEIKTTTPDPHGKVVFKDERERCAVLVVAFTVQMISAVMIFVATIGKGRNLNRFFLGCMWLLLRICPVVIFCIILFDTQTAWLHRSTDRKEKVDVLDNQGKEPYRRMAVYIFLHIALDIYFAIIVRLFAMECFDSYRYERIAKAVHYRRVPPKQSKAAKMFRLKLDGEEMADAVRFQHTRDTHTHINADLSLFPVWDRKNDVVFYGENYRDWEPSVFLAKWELLNEKYAKEQGKDEKAPEKTEKQVPERTEKQVPKKKQGKKNRKGEPSPKEQKEVTPMGNYDVVQLDSELDELTDTFLQMTEKGKLKAKKKVRKKEGRPKKKFSLAFQVKPESKRWMN